MHVRISTQFVGANDGEAIIYDAKKIYVIKHNEVIVSGGQPFRLDEGRHLKIEKYTLLEEKNSWLIKGDANLQISEAPDYYEQMILDHERENKIEAEWFKSQR